VSVIGDSYLPDDRVTRALAAAEEAFGVYGRLSPEGRARLLETIADEIGAIGDALLTTADAETGLGLVRLGAERTRTQNQLRMFAAIAREGSWVDARIDTANPRRSPPKPDLRRFLVPIGPVVVFAASNFPLAFSVAGGDSASALAAGNPVVLKAHPAHPLTSTRVADAVAGAVRRCGLPPGVFTMLAGDDHALGIALVRHPLTRAVAFTGSLRAGRALHDAACSRTDPIPVYAEMGSLNPVFVLAGALAARAPETGVALAESATLGVGQFCTKPGVVFAESSAGFDALRAAMIARFSTKAAARMLYPELAARYRQGLAALDDMSGLTRIAQAPNDAGPDSARAVLWQVDLPDFLTTPPLRQELFGPTMLLVRATSSSDLVRAAAALDGQLTATVYATSQDLAASDGLLTTLARKAGRLIFDGVPTGVEVCAAMNHGGPYPATTDVRTTSVGAAAIVRFARPICYQDAPPQALPGELRDRNENGLWRLIDNRLTREDLSEPR
jgi:alpha-ketoglutaric semialdehyde dehydrogenase